MTHEIRLRPLTVADAAEMAVVLSAPALYEFTGGEPPTEAELVRRYEAQTRGGSEDGTQIWLNELVVDVASGCAIGYVQATIPTDGGPAEIAWVIGLPWQGRGYATAAVRVLLDDLRARGVDEVEAHIHPDHVASQCVARRLGLVETDTVVDGETRWVGPTAGPYETVAP